MKFVYVSVGLALAMLLSAGCWKTQDQFDPDDVDTEEDGGDTGTGGTGECGPMMPCTTSSSSGYSCPGGNGLQCWDLSDFCNDTYVCTSQENACAIACGEDCSASGHEVPQPVCD